MSLGSLNMAGGALGTAFSLLLLASITQGYKDVEVFHYEKMEAVVGQNVTLPCTVKTSTSLNIASIEWSKNTNTKLALYNKHFGFNLFWPNVTMEIENQLMGTHLHLYGVAKWDSGTYVCDITSFPVGSIRTETKLVIKDDVKIMCDVESAVEVLTGENVTIQCRALPDAKYKWTKNKTLVSENENLALWDVTDAHTGVYTLTVNTGNQSLHKKFVIMVRRATTSLRTDLVTVPPQSNVTEEGLMEAADSGITTSPTPGLSATDSGVTWTTMWMGTDVTDDNSNSTNVTTGKHTTSYSTHVSVTSSHVTHTDHFSNSTDQEINTTHNLDASTISDQQVATSLSTTLSYGNEVFSSTQQMRNESTGGNPGATPTLSSGITTVVTEDEGGVQSHLLLLLLIIIPILLLIVAGSLYMRQTMKQRMDLPPPFKPPPPPVKYTAVRHHEIITQPFPTSRCNSVTELTDMKQMFINI